MSIGLHKKFFYKIPFEIEEFILLTIILLNVFDAAEILPITLDYIKKIISWTALGILLHKMRITKIFTGTFIGVEKKLLDKLLIFGYFLLIIKNLVAYAIGNVHTASAFMQPFFVQLATHAYVIEKVGLIVGMFLILVVAINLTFRTKIKSPSVLAILNEAGRKVDSPRRAGIRFSKVLFVIFMFFVAVFNLVMEWLAIAIDAPLLMIALGTYFFFIIKHKKRFLPGSFLAKFGNFGSKFYEDVIEHFKYKRTILRALAGLLVLHPLTDILNFLWPFLLGRADGLYFNQLSMVHPNIFQLIKQDFLIQNILQGISSIGIYLANSFALIMLLLLPGVLWILLYKNKPFKLRKSSIALVCGSLVITLLSPVFTIRPLFHEAHLGVDIIAHSVSSTTRLLPMLVLGIGFLVGLLVFTIIQKIEQEKQVAHLLTFLVQGFFTAYIIMYFVSITRAYMQTTMVLINAQEILLSIFLSIILVCSITFYVLALLSFLSDTHRHALNHLRYKNLRS